MWVILSLRVVFETAIVWPSFHTSPIRLSGTAPFYTLRGDCSDPCSVLTSPLMCVVPRRHSEDLQGRGGKWRRERGKKRMRKGRKEMKGRENTKGTRDSGRG